MTGAAFREARKRLGLTQAEIAEALGFSSQVCISAMETGKAPITLQTEKALGLLEIVRARPDA